MEHFPAFKDDVDFTERLVTEESVFCLPASVRHTDIRPRPSLRASLFLKLVEHLVSVPGFRVSQLLPRRGGGAAGDDGGSVRPHRSVLPASLSARQPRQQRPGPVKTPAPQTAMKLWSLCGNKMQPAQIHTCLRCVNILTKKKKVESNRCDGVMVFCELNIYILYKLMLTSTCSDLICQMLCQICVASVSRLDQDLSSYLFFFFLLWLLYI